MDDIIKEYTNLLMEPEDHLSSETLAIYNNLKSQLSKREVQFIEQHIDACPVCKTKLSEIIDEDLEIDPLGEEKTKVFRFSQMIKYTIAASILIAIGVSFYLVSNNSVEEVLITEETNNVEVIEDYLNQDTLKNIDEVLEKNDKMIEEELALNKNLYAVNIVLENFIERTNRSNNTISIVSPVNKKKLDLPIIFEWSETGNSDTEFILLNNKNKTIFTKQIDQNRYILESLLPKGLYYWKIKVDSKVELVGKFSI